VALEALQCGPSTDSEKRYFGRKPIRSLEKIQILALKRAIFQKCGPRADLGWPWLVNRFIAFSRFNGILALLHFPIMAERNSIYHFRHK
jgi:hypothetical protein